MASIYSNGSATSTEKVAIKTSSIMDTPLARSSVVDGRFGDHGYKMEGTDTIRILRNDFGTIGAPVNYDETSATNPFGTPALLTHLNQDLRLDFNLAKAYRIQQSAIGDTPVDNYVKSAAIEYIDQNFIPAFDKYAIGKFVAAAKAAGTAHSLTLNTAAPQDTLVEAVVPIREAGDGSTKGMVAFVDYALATAIRTKINFTGSDKGYADFSTGFLGKIGGMEVVEVPASYLGSDSTKRVRAVIADKRAVIKVKPAIEPKRDLKTLKDVPGFSGVELQIRSRGGVFVLKNKEKLFSIVQNAA